MEFSKQALVIRQPWIDLILSGEKTWEMRSKPIKPKGLIALARRGSGLVVGTAELVDCWPPLTRADYMSHTGKHAIPPGMLDEVLASGWVYPWVFANARALHAPVRYSHPSGAVTFVNLTSAVSEAIMGELSLAGGESVSRPSTPIRIYRSGAPAAAKARAPAIFEPSVAKSASSVPIFEFNPQTARATGYPLSGRSFLVIAGSTSMMNGSPHEKRDARLRDELASDGVLVADPDGVHYRFSRDFVFSSASSAAGVIQDGNASGPKLWVDRSLKCTLKEYYKNSETV